jgi:hypothetical protein
MSKGIISRAILVCALIGVGYVVGTFSGPALAQKKREYKVISVDPNQSYFGPRLESLLNKMGADGWEFVGFSFNVSDAIFKR